MTTITIKSAIELEKLEFESIDELIESYYASCGKIVLHEIKKEELDKSIIKNLENSIILGESELYDFGK